MHWILSNCLHFLSIFYVSLPSHIFYFACQSIPSFATQALLYTPFVYNKKIQTVCFFLTRPFDQTGLQNFIFLEFFEFYMLTLLLIETFLCFPVPFEVSAGIFLPNISRDLRNNLIRYFCLLSSQLFPSEWILKSLIPLCSEEHCSGNNFVGPCFQRERTSSYKFVLTILFS